jgi:hypothetical protein
MERARAALRRAVGVGGLVLLEGTDRAATTTLLQQTARDLAPTGNSLILRAGPLGPDALARTVLDAFGQAAGDAPVEELLRLAGRWLARGEPLLLMVEGAKVLPAETVCWLASLTNGSKRLVRVVLAGTDRLLLLEALAGSGTCVDLVRLETDALVPTAVDLPHLTPARSPAPAVSAPTVAWAQTGALSAAAEPNDADVLATPASAANGTRAEVPPAARRPAARVAEPERVEPMVAAARAEERRLYTIEEVLGKDAWKILEQPASDDLPNADSPKASGTGNRPDLPGSTTLETPPPHPSAAGPGRGPNRPPSPPARVPRSSWRAVWLAVFAVLVLGSGLFRLLGPSAGDRASPPPVAGRADVAAGPVDVTPSSLPPAPVEPMPPAQVLPAEGDAEAPLSEESPVPPRGPGVEPPPSEVESRVERALDDLLGEDHAGVHEDALARLVELGPRLAGPELARQINARRRGVRTHPKLRTLWRRVRKALCDSAARDPSAGPPPAELSCPQTPAAGG